VKTVKERFLEKVHKTDTCWIWRGGKNKDGYGHMKINGHSIGVHRLSWIFKNGDIPDGGEIKWI